MKPRLTAILATVASIAIAGCAGSMTGADPSRFDTGHGPNHGSVLPEASPSAVRGLP